MLKEGAALTPNFWRAPTDNDMGAGLQNKYAAWKNPGLKLISLNSKTENDQIVVNAEYDMKNVSDQIISDLCHQQRRSHQSEPKR